MKVILLRYTEDPEALAGQAAAICTNSTNWKAPLIHALKSGHESVIEHISFTFHVIDPSRALLAQLTRHRIATFSVQSQRYVDIRDMPHVVPPSIINNKEVYDRWLDLIDQIKDFYCFAINNDIPKEDARYATPQAAQTDIILTMNARELRHFFSLRCCNRAQWEIRNLADQMLVICKRIAPLIFADAGPSCVRGNCTEEKPCGHPRTK